MENILTFIYLNIKKFNLKFINMLTDQQIKLLKSYRDKAYISAVMCDECSKFYNFIRSLINIPLILSSSILTILNRKHRVLLC